MLKLGVHAVRLLFWRTIFDLRFYFSYQRESRVAESGSNRRAGSDGFPVLGLPIGRQPHRKKRVAALFVLFQPSSFP